MSRQIIKQPNGLFCIYSSIVDNVVVWDCESKEVVDEFIQQVVGGVEEKVNNIISKLNNDEKPYHQFTMTYEEMIRTIEDVHGVKEAKKTRKRIETNR